MPCLIMRSFHAIDKYLAFYLFYFICILFASVFLKHAFRTCVTTEKILFFAFRGISVPPTVADPGSGAFLSLDPGSEICKKIRIGNEQPGSYFQGA